MFSESAKVSKLSPKIPSLDKTFSKAFSFFSQSICSSILVCGIVFQSSSNQLSNCPGFTNVWPSKSSSKFFKKILMKEASKFHFLKNIFSGCAVLFSKISLLNVSLVILILIKENQFNRSTIYSGLFCVFLLTYLQFNILMSFELVRGQRRLQILALLVFWSLLWCFLLFP